MSASPWGTRGVTVRPTESPFDEYDEISNMTVFPASPSNVFGEMQSPTSEPKSRFSTHTVHQADEAHPHHRGHRDATHVSPPLQHVILNGSNLKEFERSVDVGQVTLRADVIRDDEYVNYHQAAMQAKKTTSIQKASSLMHRSTSTEEEADVASDTAGSPTFNSATSNHAADVSTADCSMWNIDKLSVDALYGSPTVLHADPLSTTTLDRHLHDLMAHPAPLTSENMGPFTIPSVMDPSVAGRGTARRNGPSISLVVEVSEADLLSSSEVFSSVRERSCKHASTNTEIPQDDMWSTASTRGVENFQLAGSGADNTLHALSKENLLQLRHQLECGKTPLRPEVLVGLGSVMRAMKNVTSEKSTSTAVEMVCTEDRTKTTNPTTTQASPMPSIADVHSPTALRYRSTADGDTSGVAAVSFHSTFVEVPATEVADRNPENGESFSPPHLMSVLPQRAHIKHNNGSEAEVLEDDEGCRMNSNETHDKSTTEYSQDGQNESVFNMTEDDVVDETPQDPVQMTQYMRDLYKLVQEGQQGQSELRQIVIEQKKTIDQLQRTVHNLETQLIAMQSSNRS